jgi:O-antigen/teichoic acid export membrane protein
MLLSLLKGGKNFSIITFCNIGVQVTSLVFFTIIARLYESQVLGEYLIYLAYASIAILLSTGFYEQALFIDKKNRRQTYILSATLLVAFCSSILALIPLSLLIPEYAIFISISILGGAMRVIARSYGIVNGRLNQVAIYDLLLSPVMPLCLMTGAILYDQETSTFLISVNSLVSFFTSLILLIYVIKLNSIKFNYSLKNSFYFSLVLLKRYINLPKYKMPSELVGILTLRLPLFVIDRFFTANLAAFYGVAFRIAITPVTVIISTVAQMFLHKVRYNRSNSIKTYNIFIKYSKFLLAVSILSIISIFTLSEWLVVQLFTDKYADVAHILKLLSPYIAVLILVSPLMGTFVIYEKQKRLLVIRISLLIFTGLGYTLAVLLNDIDYGFLTFSLSSVLVYGYAYLLMYRNYKNENFQTNSY